jgi:membrane protein required for colicin V production
MNWLDLVLAGVIGISTVTGLMRGFVRIGIGLAATVIGFLAASWFYPVAGAWAQPYTSSRGVANFVGYLIVFFGVLVAGALLSRALAKFFQWIGLSWLDRLGGGALGLIRGVLISFVIVLMISSFLPGNPPASIQQSRICPYVLQGADVLASATPIEMRQQFRRTYDSVRRAWVAPLQDQLKKSPL